MTAGSLDDVLENIGRLSTFEEYFQLVLIVDCMKCMIVLLG